MEHNLRNSRNVCPYSFCWSHQVTDTDRISGGIWRWPFDSHFTPQERTMTCVNFVLWETMIFDAFTVQISMLLVLLHGWMVSSAQRILCSIIFVKSETPHYTQNTYDLLTDHSLKVRHTSFHAKLLCGQQDMMSHSMASVLVIRTQGTGYDVTLYSICFRNIKQHSCWQQW